MTHSIYFFDLENSDPNMSLHPDSVHRQNKVDGLIWSLCPVCCLILLGFVRLQFLCVRKCIRRSQDQPQKALELITNCYNLSKSTGSEP